VSGGRFCVVLSEQTWPNSVFTVDWKCRLFLYCISHMPLEFYLYCFFMIIIFFIYAEL
jgi:hypothetical protein